MFLRTNSPGFGRVAEVKDSDGIIAGQIVKLTDVNGKLYAEKVVSGDTKDNCEVAIAYLDITDNTRRTFISASLTSREWDQALKGQNIVAVQGHDLYGTTDQLDNGNYPYGTELTFNDETALLAVAGEGDTVFATVKKAGIITTDTAGNKQGTVDILLSI